MLMDVDMLVGVVNLLGVASLVGGGCCHVMLVGVDSVSVGVGM